MVVLREAPIISAFPVFVNSLMKFSLRRPGGVAVKTAGQGGFALPDQFAGSGDRASMRRLAAWALVPLLLLLSCGGAPSKTTARTILDEHYREKGSVYEPLLLSLGRVTMSGEESDVGDDSTDVFFRRVGKHAETFRMLWKEGLITITYDREQWVHDPFEGNRLYFHFHVVPTDEGKKYARHPNTTNWRSALFRIAEKRVDKVTGVFETGKNAVKVHYRVVLTDRTPFFAAISPLYAPPQSANMTALLANDGERWRVMRVVEGTF